MNRLKIAAITASIALAVSIVLPVNHAYAGDREWATVGKILTGVVGAGLLYETVNGGYYSQNNGYYYRNECEVPDVVIITPQRGGYYGHHRKYYYPRQSYRKYRRDRRSCRY